MEVTGGGLEVGVAEEFLDGVDVYAVADELGGKSMAEGVGSNLL